MIAWFWVETATCPVVAKSLRNNSIFSSAGSKSARDRILWNYT
ncbi:MAG TPA: hypothetical protein PKI20_06795 [Verrucomicrobiota bacterium]|nr:hypothetical protein [Verrucomicrobiota bacterium]HQL79317.1 hypothetical protein [Verrucomicrobiota bacterium]